MRKLNLLAIILLFIFLGCSKDYVVESKKQNTQAKPVKLRFLDQVRDPISIYGSGLLKSDTEITLAFKTGGIVASVNAQEGDLVKKGDLLAKLDLAEIEAKVNKARNAFEKNRRDLLRVKNLYADSVATLEQVEDAKTALEIAEADLRIAEFNHKHSHIFAPVNGRVLSKRIDQQELVGVGQPAFILGSSEPGGQIVQVGFSDKDIVKVNLGDSALVHFDAIHGKKFKAMVEEISEVTNPRTGTYNIKLRLYRDYHTELKNGFVAKVELFTTVNSAYYKIPVDALVEANKKCATVFLSNDKRTVVKKKLTIDRLFDDFFTVGKSQLDSSQWVVVEGAPYLNENDSITINN